MLQLADSFGLQSVLVSTSVRQRKVVERATVFNCHMNRSVKENPLRKHDRPEILSDVVPTPAGPFG